MALRDATRIEERISYRININNMASQLLLPSSDSRFLLNVHSRIDPKDSIAQEGLSSIFDQSLVESTPSIDLS